MASVRRFLEWYLGLSPAESGQGTRWRWSLDAPLLSSVAGSLLLLLVICVVAACFYWLGTRRVVRARRIALLATRLLIVVVVSLCAMKISLAVDRTGLPWLAILIDQSASMAREDIGAPADTSRTSRLLAIQQWLCRDEPAGPLAELSRRYRLRLFAFANDAREIEPPTGEDEFKALSAAVQELRADGTQTRPATALRTVLNEFRGAPPAAVLVFSDGVSSRGGAEKLSTVAEDAKRGAVPIWTVGLGSMSSAVDRNLVEVLYDRVAIAGDAVTFETRIMNSGAANQPVEVQLIDADGNVADSATASLASDGSLSAMLSDRPADEGRHDYVVQVVPAATETDRDNNSRRVSVDVRSQKIRVLYVERFPRWEFRHLKATLERDDAVELKTVLLDSDVDYTREDRTALTQPPGEAAELLAFDTVILGDVDPRSLPRQFLDHVKTLVGQNAGGLILIAGDRFNPTAFRGTSLDGLLPINAPEGGDPVTPADHLAFLSPVVTDTGRSHPLLRIDADQPETATELPEVGWWALTSGLRPGATALAEILSDGQSPQPVLVVQRYGSGRVLWHGVDELWKWRRFREDAIYGRYWSQAVRWASRERLAAGSLAVLLRTDRRVYSPGSTVQVQLSTTDGLPLADGTAPQIRIEQDAGAGRVVTLNSQPASPGRYEVQVPGLGTGNYRLHWIESDGKESVDWEFRIDADSAELQGVPQDREDLARTAEISRGRFMEWEQVDGLLEALPTGRSVVTSRGTSVPVWSRWEPAILIALLLCLEWFLRRRQRLV